MATIGPGPGAYGLPSTVGYNKHDPSRYRNPQFTMPGGKRGFDASKIGPGPTYTITGMTQHGKLSSPAYTIKSKPKELSRFSAPGPGTYTPTPFKPTPAYSMRGRNKIISKNVTPGPNQYLLPSTMGPKVPDKVANPGYSMLSKHFLEDKSRSPGPATYAGGNLNLIQPKQPAFTIAGRNFPPGNKLNSPGPAAYLPNKPKVGTGGLPFGIRTPARPYITADDFMPCMNR